MLKTCDSQCHSSTVTAARTYSSFKAMGTINIKKKNSLCIYSSVSINYIINTMWIRNLKQSFSIISLETLAS